MTTVTIRRAGCYIVEELSRYQCRNKHIFSEGEYATGELIALDESGEITKLNVEPVADGESAPVDATPYGFVYTDTKSDGTRDAIVTSALTTVRKSDVIFPENVTPEQLVSYEQALSKKYLKMVD